MESSNENLEKTMKVKKKCCRPQLIDGGGIAREVKATARRTKKGKREIEWDRNIRLVIKCCEERERER